MAREPDCLIQRRILNAKTVSPDSLRRRAGELEAGGFLADALELYGKAGEQGAVENIAARAVEEGDGFLLRRAARILGRAPSSDELSRLAARADDLGKRAFADQARERLQEPVSQEKE